jgi:hypothetical protein
LPEIEFLLINKLAFAVSAGESRKKEFVNLNIETSKLWTLFISILLKKINDTAPLNIEIITLGYIHIATTYSFLSTFL